MPVPRRAGAPQRFPRTGKWFEGFPSQSVRIGRWHPRRRLLRWCNKVHSPRSLIVVDCLYPDASRPSRSPVSACQTVGAKPTPEVQELLESARKERRARHFIAAEPLYARALDVAVRTRDRNGETDAIFGLAQLHWDKGSKRQALEDYRRCLGI